MLKSKLANLSGWTGKLGLAVLVGSLVTAAFAFNNISKKSAQQTNNQQTQMEVDPALIAQAKEQLRGANDPWVVFLNASDVSEQTFEKVAPNFPGLSTAPEVVAKRKAWVTKYPAEAEALLSAMKTDKFNPSRIALGMTWDAPVKRENVVYHPYWTQYQKNSDQIALDKAAPHFPKPDLNADPNTAGERYGKAVENWMTNYPEELSSFLGATAVKVQSNVSVEYEPGDGGSEEDQIDINTNSRDNNEDGN